MSTALTDTDRRGLTPPFWTHVAPYGEVMHHARPTWTARTLTSSRSATCRRPVLVVAVSPLAAKEAARTSVSSSRPKNTSETTLISVMVSINAGTTQEYDDLRNIRSSAKSDAHAVKVEALIAADPYAQRLHGSVGVDHATPVRPVSMLLTSQSVSQSASQAAAFFQEVARHRLVWHVRDDHGSPAPKTSGGERAMPYWSTQARAQRAADIWNGGLRAVSVSMETWRNEELPTLADEGCRVGINWTGPRLVGWDFTVAEVLNRLAHALREGPYSDDGENR